MSSCSDDACCVYAGDIYEHPSFIGERVVVAKKAHKCVECRREIFFGEKYEYIAGVWDGEFATFQTCIDCLSVKKSFFCGGYEFGGIWPDLREHIRDFEGNIPSDCIIALTRTARDKVCDLIQEAWAELDPEV